MAAPRQHKRLRVRLRSGDPEDLARDFGRYLRPDGLFLPCKEQLTPKTQVRFVLLYSDGRVALEGRGHVLRCDVRPMAGLDLALAWTPLSRALVEWCTADPRPPLDTSPLVNDLAPPSEKAPVPRSWVDEDEPLTKETPPDDSRSSRAADELDDEPLAMRDEGSDDEAPSLPPAEASDSAGARRVRRGGAAENWSAHQARLSAGVSPWQSPSLPPKLGTPVPQRSPEPNEWDDESPPPASDDFDVLVDPHFTSSTPGIERLTSVAEDEPVTVVETMSDSDEASSVLILPPDINPSRESEADVDPGAVTIVDRGQIVENKGPPLEPTMLEPAELYSSGTIELPLSALEAGDWQRRDGAHKDAPLPTNGREVSRESLGPDAGPGAKRVPAEARAPGEVTPLARIALVRRRADSYPGEEDSIPATAIPSKRHRPGLPPKGRRVVGIDLGTATTAMAALVEGRPRLIPSRRGTRVIPSVVVIEPSGRTFVGEGAARKLPWYPKLGIAGPSRLLGLVAGGPQAGAWAAEIICDIGPGDESEVAATLGPHTVSVEEVVALLLKEVRASVTVGLREPINRAVITCPTFFGARQRQALRVAAELAGFHVESIVPSSIAAAMELVAGRPRPGRVMVVDCGAGALDVSLVEMTSEGMTLVAARGDRDLGGDAYDQLLVRHLAKVTHNLDGVSGLGGYFDIREAAELGKWTLSEQENAHVAVDHPGDENAEDAWHLSAEIRRDESDDLFLPLVERSIALCKRVCHEAGWPLESIDCVVPVGGQARIPILHHHLREAFGSALTTVDPQTAVPFGAARIAERVVEGAPLAWSEVVPHSVSIGLAGGGLDRIITRGAQLPAVASRTVRVAESSDLDVFLFEGEGQDVSQVEPLTRLTLMEVPSEIAMPFDVQFNVEMATDGMLRFQAIEARTGQRLAVMTNAVITLEAIRWHLKMPSLPTAPGRDDSVFAWLRRRLERAASARQRPPA